MALIDDLVSYWKLDEASGNALDAHASNDGTDTNTVGSDTGKIGNARSFNGTNERFNVGNPASLQLSNANITIACWIKTADAGASYRNILTKDSAWVLGLKDNVLQSYDWSGSGDHLGSGDISNDAWRHVAVVLQAGVSSGSQLYLDGATNGSAWTVGTNNTQTNNVAIGGLSSNLGDSEYYAGLIDELGIWNRALSGGEIASLYNSGTGLAYPFSASFVPFPRPRGLNAGMSVMSGGLSA